MIHTIEKITESNLLITKTDLNLEIPTPVMIVLAATLIKRVQTLINTMTIEIDPAPGSRSKSKIITSIKAANMRAQKTVAPNAGTMAKKAPTPKRPQSKSKTRPDQAAGTGTGVAVQKTSRFPCQKY
jgi:hypothetical protein